MHPSTRGRSLRSILRKFKHARLLLWTTPFAARGRRNAR
jgi:hypothetical protein